jgi:hypothetical protein
MNKRNSLEHCISWSFGFLRISIRAVFLLGEIYKKRYKNKSFLYIVREKNRKTSRHLFPTKENFVFLSFVFSFGINLYYVIVRFECIGALGSE